MPEAAASLKSLLGTMQLRQQPKPHSGLNLETATPGIDSGGRDINSSIPNVMSQIAHANHRMEWKPHKRSMSAADLSGNTSGMCSSGGSKKSNSPENGDGMFQLGRGGSRGPDAWMLQEMQGVSWWLWLNIKDSCGEDVDINMGGAGTLGRR